MNPFDVQKPSWKPASKTQHNYRAGFSATKYADKMFRFSISIKFEASISLQPLYRLECNPEIIAVIGCAWQKVISSFHNGANSNKLLYDAF